MASEARQTPRIGIVDAVRGAACVAMILWHTADAWLLPEIHGTPSFERVRLVGGLAAPYFLWLAGLSLALSTELRPSVARTAAGLVRAGWVIAVGYALKLLAWTIDHGAIRDPTANGRTLLVAIPSMAALLLAFHEPPRASPRVRVLAGTGGVAGLIFAYSHLGGTTHASNVLARLDVLHGIGAALGVGTLLLFALGRLVPSERARALVLAALAIGVAVATPRWIGVSLDPLPSRLADYLARTTSDPAASGARFALFPWLGYALYGAAIGTLLRAAPRDLAPSEVPFVRRPWALALAAFLVSALVFEGGPVGREITARAEWARPVLRLSFYGTTALGVGGVSAYLGRHAAPLFRGLTAMGKRSLLVYGVHLELAYGLLGVPLQRNTGWLAWALGAAVLTVLMAVLAERAEKREKGRDSGSRRDPPPSAAAA